MGENEKMTREKKILSITILSASVAFVVALLLTSEEDNIFSGVTDYSELRRVWLEYNLNNHPDKCSLEGEDLNEHMKDYHRTKKLYEDLAMKFKGS